MCSPARARRDCPPSASCRASTGPVGYLGGGPLELTEVKGQRIKAGLTLPLGGLALQDVSSKSVKKAEKIVRTALEDARLLEGGKGRTFYAIGGTWRALARLHMW